MKRDIGITRKTFLPLPIGLAEAKATLPAAATAPPCPALDGHVGSHQGPILFDEDKMRQAVARELRNLYMYVENPSLFADREVPPSWKRFADEFKARKEA